MRRILVFATVILFVGLSTSSAQDKPLQTWSAKSQASEYRIGAGDVLEISTWKEPDLSRKEILVRVDGRISFPLLSDIPAAGMTPVLKRTAYRDIAIPGVRAIDRLSEILPWCGA